MNVINRVTLAGLKKNRTRTIVTIIGVILSAAMITAVTTLIASLQGYMIAYTKADVGDWHAAFYGRDAADLSAISELPGVAGLAVTQSGGYALLPDSENESKPYLHVLQYDQAAFTTLPVHLLTGRMPEQVDEILVPEHVSTNGGVRYQVGDRLTLGLGQRQSRAGAVLGQADSYQLDDQGKVAEQLVVTETRTFTVVGICERPSSEVEGYGAPGFTVIAPLDPAEIATSRSLNVYFQATAAKDIYALTEQISAACQIENPRDLNFNDDLLRFMGVSDQENFLAVLYGLAAILLTLIMVGSVSLIYNSFSISVSERRKQFGLLSGVGATSRQLRHSVFFEALVVGGIGIPLGILAGIIGIGITIYCLRDTWGSLIGSAGSEPGVIFKMIVPLSSVAVAAVVALVTILISAYIPARRTARMSAMDAIRQTADVKMTAKQVRTPRLVRKLFGLEGDFALKNLKRNRRRYRSTVISLFISVVLFVSAVSFSTYLRDSVTNVYEDTDYDLSYYLSTNDQRDAVSLRDSVLASGSVQESSIVSSFSGRAKLSQAQLTPAYWQQLVSQGAAVAGQDTEVIVYVYGVDATTFAEYAASLGLATEQLRDSTAPAGILLDQQHFYDGGQRKYLNTNLLAQVPEALSLTAAGADGSVEADVTITALATTAPFGIADYSTRGSLTLILDEQLATSVFGSSGSVNLFFSAADPARAEVEIKQILQAGGLSTSYLYNVADMLESTRNLLTIIAVFSYGFIVLMALITVANVFNTISTNVNLRKREFAMLKSVGMTEQGLNRMLDFECTFYGMKALLYGLPVSVAVAYLIYQSITQGVEMPFYVPMQGILISVVSVFLVVFISMRYSRDKVRRENILDALKNENL